MGLKNGRATYTELKEQYEKVIIRHDIHDEGTARTTCFLVKGGNIFVGIAKFSNRTFNFSRKKGRAIAQGRAEHAVNVFLGKATKRVSQEKRREELSYIIFSTEDNTVEDILSNFLDNEKEVVQ
jgi:hypothetical protein